MRATEPKGRALAPLLLLDELVLVCPLDDCEVDEAPLPEVVVAVPAACRELASETMPAKTEEANDDASSELPPCCAAKSETTLDSIDAVMAS